MSRGNLVKISPRCDVWKVGAGNCGSSAPG
ncbi:hypothetical protein PVAP13_7NG097517 [Panicum virgatum]|uniref:Uncharacterized protein n=1 Tax=Panicum virgatum TaxID=38727 RepID=A0A8T0PY62_PANVG|nr:hypothetical protein PVAP13_7NG097517 [Panicum virgatum]